MKSPRGCFMQAGERRWARYAAFFSLILASAVAAADAGDQARAHYDDANAAYALGNYARAAEEFERAFELKPDPALLFNAAQGHRLAGNNARALLLYQNYLSLSAPGQQRRRDATPHRRIEASHRERRPLPLFAVGGAAAGRPVRSLNDASRAAAAGSAVAAPLSSRRTRAAPVGQARLVLGRIVGGTVVVAGAVALGITLGSTTRYPSPSMGRRRAIDGVLVRALTATLPCSRRLRPGRVVSARYAVPAVSRTAAPRFRLPSWKSPRRFSAACRWRRRCSHTAGVTTGSVEIVFPQGYPMGNCSTSPSRRWSTRPVLPGRHAVASRSMPVVLDRPALVWTLDRASPI